MGTKKAAHEARLFIPTKHHQLASAVTSSFHAGNHRTVVVRAILRDLTGLLARPLLALGAIRRLLLAALAILWVHKYLTGCRTAGSRT
jgi:hypothetical protein